MFFGAASFAQGPTCQEVFAASKIAPHRVYNLREFDGLMDQLKAHGDFQNLYSQYNEAVKKITIEEHTRDVFRQFLIETHHAPLDRRILKIMPVTIALHDIGKPLAISAGNRDSQHLFTVPIMESFLKENGWDSLDIKRSLALVSFTGFGQVLKKEKTAFMVAQEINKLARELEMTPKEFYLAKRAFFLADAGAYQQLRGAVLVEMKQGRLDSKGPQLDELEFWLFSGMH